MSRNLAVQAYAPSGPRDTLWPMGEDGEKSGESKLVCFYLGEQEFAAKIEFIKESLPVKPITRVALTPPWMAGIINLRGDVVAVLDLSLYLGMAPTEVSKDSRIIIALHDKRRLGLLCDRLSELVDLNIDEIQPPPSTLPEQSSAVMAGIATLEDGHAIRVLDLPALYDSKQLAAFRRGGPS